MTKTHQINMPLFKSNSSKEIRKLNKIKQNQLTNQIKD